MKLFSGKKVMLFAVAFATLLVCVVQADPRARNRKSGILDQNEEERYVLVTGSRIPQKVMVRSIGTTTPYNLRVYNRHDLDRSGRFTTGEALRTLDPSIQLSGR